MKRNILEIYALAVCFFTVACAVVALGIGVYDVVQIAAPEFTLSDYGRHTTNQEFFRGAEKQAEALSEEEKTKRRTESYALTIKSERRDATQSLVIVLIILGIDAILFLFHWRLARRAREAA